MTSLFIPWVLLALAVLSVLMLALMFVCPRKGRPVLLLIEGLILASMIIINCRGQVFSFGAVTNGSWLRNSDLALGRKDMNGNEGTFKVMSFNVNGGSELFSAERMKVLIDAEDPDFLYLIECAWTEDVLDALDRYPFKVRTFDGVMAAKSSHDSSSDMPGARSATVSYPELSFFLCHLASNNSFKDDEGKEVYITPDRLADASSLRRYLENVETQSAVRFDQAKMICEADSVGRTVTPKPVIIMGDMNDVGGSEALRQLKKAGFRDAWWTGGFGYGATYHEPLPFRIDHIYYSPELRLRDIRILRSADWGTESVPLSDHDALVATFSIP